MMSLSARLRSTLLVVGLVQLLVVLLALVLAVQTRNDQRSLVNDYFRTVADSHEGFVRALDTNAAAATYLRLGDEESLAELRRLQQPRAGAVDIDLLRERLSDDPAAVAALDQVVADYVAWLTGLEPLVARVENGGPSAVGRADVQASLRGFGVVREGYGAYIDEVLAARDRAANRLVDRTRLLFGAVLLAVAVAVVTGFALYSALRRWVVRPLDSLADETRTVRSGDLHHEVRAQGPPEIMQLGVDVEAMRRGLVEQLAQVERAQRLLEQQADELRRSNRDLEQFAYVASHDLQEPLRKVSSFCQMLERRYKGQLDERADQYIEFAVDGAKRMQLLINDLLAFSRVGRISDGVAEVPMDEVLADALRNLSTRIEESGATVTADPLPTVHGERRLLVQLLQNLVGNALKFRSEEAPRVHVGAVREDDCWQFCVTDNGIGVEPQYAERIFVIFQRLHPKAEYEGTGIGLALCKKIVEHHGGTIWLDTEVQTGTTFRWTLPVDAPVVVPHQDEAPLGAKEEPAWTTT